MLWLKTYLSTISAMVLSRYQPKGYIALEAIWNFFIWNPTWLNVNKSIWKSFAHYNLTPKDPQLLSKIQKLTLLKNVLPKLRSKMERVKQAFNRGILEEVVDVDLLKTLEMLARVVGNLVNFPTELKYRKIPADNKMFNEAVINAKGGLEFVVACGFHKKDIDGRDFWSNEEYFLNFAGKTFWAIENPNAEVLQFALNLVNERIDKIKKKQEQEMKRLDEVILVLKQ